MTASNDETAPAWTDPDDAPDLSAPEWHAKVDAAPVTRPRGRPRSDAPKVSTNLRLSPDVLDAYKATGPGWQTRMDAALWEVVARLRTEHRKSSLDAMVERRRGMPSHNESAVGRVRKKG